ncbi:MAG TPA: zinc-dependent metalloprotease [Stackebrandtia sp.]|jgi:coenzyme F420 biosynthesis associated uncharacterized protein|uniref:zinc-dependent metalloprotease n=1 Tax=Stackebrandtia sp. TaxID=2023065 RepID=UPI002D6A4279|nr:zinc-dependent metalloprotease [Stackebrandtia sp.]HZE38833.1 zinc-dependent metalloprotease [Stackebrandtia sp.]
MTQFVDWDLAAATARTIGRAGPDIGLEHATAAVTRLRECAAEATDRVADFTSLSPSTPHATRVVDRAAWAAANIEGLKKVLDPMARKLSGEPSSATRLVGSRVAGAQAGAVLGFLSSKVLGQYEVFGEANGQLLLVAPNIVEVERELRVDPADFGMWVCLHEATHAAQFGVPWLRGHFMSEIDAFASAAPGSGLGLMDRARRGVEFLADALRGADNGSSIVDLVTSPEQRAIVERLTALMTLLEGHADYVMDAVGPQVVSDVATLRERFDARRATANPAQKVLRRLLGMDLKLQQYIQGKKFTEAVVDEVGVERFNLVWSAPEALPTSDEISHPERWIDRVAG